jgi:hypothetical protein
VEGFSKHGMNLRVPYGKGISLLAEWPLTYKERTRSMELLG